MQKSMECSRTFTFCFNFDLDRSANKKNVRSKMSIFKPCQKTVSPLINDNEQGPSGGPREKSITFLLRGRMIFYYHVNGFWTFSLLSKYLPTKTPIFKEKIVKKMQFLSPPPDGQCRFLLEVKQMPQWLVSSEVLTTHKVWGKGSVWPFSILLNP